MIVADNSDDGAAVGLQPPVARVSRRVPSAPPTTRETSAPAPQRGDWLLFVDADCEPSPGLIDAYFAEQIGAGIGAVAGEIVGRPDQRALAARYARSRKVMSQTEGLYGRARAVAATGNLLVRAAAVPRARRLRRGDPLGRRHRLLPAPAGRRMGARVPSARRSSAIATARA